MTSSTCDEIRGLLNAEGFANSGFARLERPLSIEIYRDWLDKGHAGEMSYLERHYAEKEEPQKLLPKAQSAIVVTESYFPHPRPFANSPLKAARVALYAQGEDYHFWLKQKLMKAVAALKARYPQEEFVIFTDSSPVLERDLAYRAGLGWIGKNTCLVHPKRGSLFFIGEIYTSLILEQAELPTPDHCGKCTRCLDICPTGALTAPRELDARKCISYLTIESKSVPEKEIRAQIGDWLFGCDLCQTICPWNLKTHSHQSFTAAEVSEAEDRQNLIDDLRLILTASNNQLLRLFHGSALARAGGRGLKRNALIICSNRKLHELLPEIEVFTSHPTLGELAHQTIATLQA